MMPPDFPFPPSKPKPGPPAQVPDIPDVPLPPKRKGGSFVLDRFGRRLLDSEGKFFVHDPGADPCCAETMACCLSTSLCEELTYQQCIDRGGTPRIGLHCNDPQWPCPDKTCCDTYEAPAAWMVTVSGINVSRCCCYAPGAPWCSTPAEWQYRYSPYGIYPSIGGMAQLVLEGTTGCMWRFDTGGTTVTVENISYTPQFLSCASTVMSPYAVLSGLTVVLNKGYSPPNGWIMSAQVSLGGEYIMLLAEQPVDHTCSGIEFVNMHTLCTVNNTPYPSAFVGGSLVCSPVW